MQYQMNANCPEGWHFVQMQYLIDEQCPEGWFFFVQTSSEPIFYRIGQGGVVKKQFTVHLNRVTIVRVEPS